MTFANFGLTIQRLLNLAAFYPNVGQSFTSLTSLLDLFLLQNAHWEQDRIMSFWCVEKDQPATRKRIEILTRMSLSGTRLREVGAASAAVGGVSRAQERAGAERHLASPSAESPLVAAGRAQLRAPKERMLVARNEGETFWIADFCRMARHTSPVTLSDSDFFFSKIRTKSVKIQQNSGKN